MSNIPMEGLAEWLRSQIPPGHNGPYWSRHRRWASEVESASARLAEATIAQPVARLHIRLEDDGLEAQVEVLNGENLQVEDSPVDVYLHPAPKGEDAAGVLGTPEGGDEIPCGRPAKLLCQGGPECWCKKENNDGR